uniref:RNA-directed RNA polymerase n=1 Tax=Diaporthe gulyae chuvirus 1 TaxID=3077421 RepID=A0AA96HA00_9VIRU|nr:MAG: RNA-dependent RNA polymerase [Diaporthe gulyae chuvirus 1]
MADINTDDIDVGQHERKRMDGQNVFFDTKLSVAIRKTTTNKAMRAMDSNEEGIGWTRDERIAYYVRKKYKGYEVFQNADTYTYIISKLLDGVSHPEGLDHHEHNLLRKVSEPYQKTIALALEHLMKSVEDVGHSAHQNILDASMSIMRRRGGILKRLISFYNTYDSAVTIASTLGRTELRDSNFWKFITKRTVKISQTPWVMVMGYSVFFFIIDDQVHVLPKAYLLLIHNKLCDLISVTITAEIQCCNIYSEVERDLYYSFIKEGFRLNRRYKSKVFTIWKSLEGLVQAEQILDADSLRESFYLTNMVISLEDETGFDYSSSELREILRSCSPPFRNELGCLSKIFGHPYVDIEGGIKKMLERAREEKVLDIGVIAETGWMAKKMYIEKYISKHKKWPEVNMERCTDRRLNLAKREDRQPTDLRYSDYGQIDLAAYDSIDILKNQKFEYFLDCNQLIKDKTITQLASAVYRQAKGEEKLRPDEHYKKTKLIIKHFLDKDAQFRHQEYLARFNDIKNDPSVWDELSEYMVLRVVPKEKELKEMFRGFGCQSHENRDRTLRTEYNVADMLDELYEEEAMTCTELEISRKLIALRHMAKSFPGYQAVTISIDAQSWCSGFRSLAMRPFLSLLDSIFDVNTYDPVQDYYQELLYYLADSETVHFWKGMYGGIEGLNQYTWVLAYLSQINAAMDKLGYLFKVLIKGDDVRITVLISDDELNERDMDWHREHIVSSLHDYLGRVGHKIKKEDSYSSMKFISFSKNASIGDAELPQSFRKCQKAYGANNAAIKTVDSYIGSSFSNCHSASRAGVDFVSSYSLAVFWSMTYLKRSNIYKECPNDMLVALLLTPSVVGGFPIIYWHNFLVRAESDLLTPFIDLCKMMEISDHVVFNYMSRFLQFNIENEPHVDIFFRDSYAIPITGKPQTADSYLKTELTKRIEKVSKNPTIEELFSTDTKDIERQLIDILSTSNIYIPRLISEVFSKSALGMKQEVLTKFESGKSMAEFFAGSRDLNSRRANNIMIATFKKDQRVNEWRVNRMTKNMSFDVTHLDIFSQGCSARGAKWLRDTLWKKPVTGVTMPCMQDFIRIVPRERLFGLGEHAERSHFLLNAKVKPMITNLDKKMGRAYQLGPFRPFVGAVTSSGNHDAMKTVESREPMANKSLGLLSCITWITGEITNADGVQKTSNMPDVVAKLFQLTTSAAKEHLSEYVRVKKSGTMTHHMSGGGFKAKIAVNSLSNATTMFMGVSSAHKAFSVGNYKYNVNFLQIYSHAMMLLTMIRQYDPNFKLSTMYWIITAECEFCSRPIIPEIDEFMTCNEASVNSFDPPTLRTISSIIGVDELYHELVQQEIISPTIVMRDIDIIDVNTAIAALLQHHLTIKGIDLLESLTGINARLIRRLNVDLARPLLSTNHEQDVLSITEIRRMPFETIFNALHEFIQEYIWWKYRGRTIAQISLSIQRNFAVHLPWYQLCFMLREAWELTPFLHYVFGRTHSMFRIDDSPNSLDGQVKELGVALIRHYVDLDIPRVNFTRLSNSADRSVGYHLAVKLRRYYKVLINRARAAGIPPTSADHNLTELCRSYKWYTCHNDNEAAIEIFNHDYCTIGFICIRIMIDLVMDWFMNNIHNLDGMRTIENQNILCANDFTFNDTLFVGHLNDIIGYLETVFTERYGDKITLAQTTGEIANYLVNRFPDGEPLNMDEFQDLLEDDRFADVRRIQVAHATIIEVGSAWLINQRVSMVNLFMTFIRSNIIPVNILYTDLSTCISRIRREPTLDRTRVPRGELPPGLQGQVARYTAFSSLAFAHNANEGVNRFEWKDLTNHTAPVRHAVSMRIAEKVQKSGYYVDVKSFPKIYGLGSGTATHLIEVLVKSGMLRDKFYDMNLLMLADGTGGNTQIMNEITSKSTFFYVSLDQPPGQCPIHPYVVDKIRERGNRLVNRYNSAGIADLSLPQIVETLMNDTNGRVNGVFCDVSFPADESEMIMVNIFHNVTSLYLRSRLKSLLYLRCNITMLTSTRGMSCLCQVIFHSVKTYLVKPSSSQDPNEYYLVAQRSGTPIDHSSKYLSPNGFSRVESMINNQIDGYNLRLDYANPSYEFRSFDLPPGDYCFAPSYYLPSSFIPRIPVDMHDRRLLETRQELNARIETFFNSYNHCFSNTTYYREFSLSEKVREMERYIKLRGFMRGYENENETIFYNQHVFSLSTVINAAFRGIFRERVFLLDVGLESENLRGVRTRVQEWYFKSLRYGVRARLYFDKIEKAFRDMGAPDVVGI